MWASPGFVVTGRYSCSKGRKFESLFRVLVTYMVLCINLFCKSLIRPKINQKSEPTDGLSNFFKKNFDNKAPFSRHLWNALFRERKQDFFWKIQRPILKLKSVCVLKLAKAGTDQQDKNVDKTGGTFKFERECFYTTLNWSESICYFLRSGWHYIEWHFTEALF